MMTASVNEFCCVCASVSATAFVCSDKAFAAMRACISCCSCWRPRISAMVSLNAVDCDCASVSATIFVCSDKAFVVNCACCSCWRVSNSDMVSLNTADCDCAMVSATTFVWSCCIFANRDNSVSLEFFCDSAIALAIISP